MICVICDLTKHPRYRFLSHSQLVTCFPVPEWHACTPLPAPRSPQRWVSAPGRLWLPALPRSALPACLSPVSRSCRLHLRSEDQLPPGEPKPQLTAWAAGVQFGSRRARHIHCFGWRSHGAARCFPFLRGLSVLDAFLRLPFFPDGANGFEARAKRSVEFLQWSWCLLKVLVSGQGWVIIECSSPRDRAMVRPAVLLSALVGISVPGLFTLLGNRNVPPLSVLLADATSVLCIQGQQRQPEDGGGPLLSR